MIISMPYECPPQNARQSKPFPCENLAVYSKKCPNYPKELVKHDSVSSDAFCMVCGEKFCVRYHYAWKMAPRTCGKTECKQKWRLYSKNQKTNAIREAAEKMKKEKGKA